jgi:hypothetical protein
MFIPVRAIPPYRRKAGDFPRRVQAINVHVFMDPYPIEQGVRFIGGTPWIYEKDDFWGVLLYA